MSINASLNDGWKPGAGTAGVFVGWDWRCTVGELHGKFRLVLLSAPRQREQRK